MESSDDDEISWSGFLARELRGRIFRCFSFRHILIRVVFRSSVSSLMISRFFPGGGGGSESADTAVCFVFVFVSADIGREVRSEGSSLDHATLSAMNSWNLIA